MPVGKNARIRSIASATSYRGHVHTPRSPVEVVTKKKREFPDFLPIYLEYVRGINEFGFEALPLLHVLGLSIDATCMSAMLWRVRLHILK